MLGIFSKTHIVSRNGLTFQVPISNFCRLRFMAVHSDGTGTSWEEAAPDIDQPLGLSYRELQDIRKGVRKRAEFEHKAFADNTVGMTHKPGGCAILDIVDQTIDISIDDDTYKGRNILYDQTGSSLWCFTNTDGTASTPDGYRLMWGPKSICSGGDYTWSGGHLFTTAEISAAPTADDDIPSKKYVDDGGMRNVNGTPTVVHTLYLSGNLDNDSGTVVAHGIANGLTKIVWGQASALNDSLGGYVAIEAYISSDGNNAIVCDYDDDNFTFSSVGAFYRTNGYKIKIDYID